MLTTPISCHIFVFIITKHSPTWHLATTRPVTKRLEANNLINVQTIPNGATKDGAAARRGHALRQ
jgi:hypothetical protein